MHIARLGHGRLDLAALRARVEELGPWFHNIDLNGVATAPDHFLGDYPAFKFTRFADALPDDLTGKSVLDIGCNAGFYSLEMKRRGAAEVLVVSNRNFEGQQLTPTLQVIRDAQDRWIQARRIWNRQRRPLSGASPVRGRSARLQRHQLPEAVGL